MPIRNLITAAQPAVVALARGGYCPVLALLPNRSSPLSLYDTSLSPVPERMKAPVTRCIRSRSEDPEKTAIGCCRRLAVLVRRPVARGESGMSDISRRFICFPPRFCRLEVFPFGHAAEAVALRLYLSPEVYDAVLLRLPTWLQTVIGLPSRCRHSTPI